ncbi:alpha/beta hydrolase family protein [Elusimicrobiota bacterium]
MKQGFKWKKDHWRPFAYGVAVTVGMAGIAVLIGWHVAHTPRNLLRKTLKVDCRPRWNTAELLSVKAHKGVTLQTFQMSAAKGIKGQAYLLLPNMKDIKERVLPAVIVMHGHNMKPEDTFVANPDSWMRPVALELAKEGFVVLVPKIPHYNPDSRLEETLDAMKLLLRGKTMTGERVAAVLRHVDFLTEHPQVDKDRIGILGWSMGGGIAQYAMALDPRLKAAFLSGCFVPLKFLAEDDILHSPDNYIPSMIERFGEPAQLAPMLAPRPLMAEHGTNDQHESFDMASSAFDKLHAVYKKKGAPDSAVFLPHKQGHAFYGRKAVWWFKKWFQ